MAPRSNTAILTEIAAARPDAVALWDCGVETTYHALMGDAGKAARALDDAGVAPGDTVLIGWDSLTRHVTLLLALEALGATAASYDGALKDANYDALFGEAARVLTPLAEETASIPEVRTDDGWWRAVLSGPDAELPDRMVEPDQGFRIVRTSGTTGRANLMRAGRAAAYARIDALRREYGYSATSRFMTAMPFAFQAVDHNAFACLREGGTVCFENRVLFADALVRTEATHSALLPMDAHYMDRPECRAIDGAPVCVIVYGGAISEAMLTRLKERHPAASFITTYATNEVGTVARRVAENLYRIIADAEAQIVDEAGRPVPPGEEGHIRVRRTGMYEGYIGDPERTALRFRDGWFHPGDLGVMTEDGLLRVIGRSDDILNVRGLKLPAATLEDRLQEITGLSGAALVDLPASGKLCLVLQPAPGVALDAILPHVQEILPREAGEIDVVTTKEIPRTDSGKIRRAALRDALARREG